MRALTSHEATQKSVANAEASLCACNVCGRSEFGYGPSRRLSVSGRLPHCLGCSSLERHRIAHRIFDALSPTHTKGKRLLQFSPDPGVNPSWFEEMVVSIWGGANSLDIQNIALPAARYDWVYSSHVLNHVPDPSAALREMLRVVGPRGVVALSVGGTVTKYENATSERVFGPDRQFIVYGSQFADHVLVTLPHVAVLELVAVDACTGSIDSLYLYSQDESSLHDMARRAAAKNIHGRVFKKSGSPTSTSEQTEVVDPAPVASPPLAPCNVCGGRAFDVGPRGRTSLGNRLPLCEGCFSLERHRIAQHVLGVLRHELEGTRFLQFGQHLRLGGLGLSEAVSAAPSADVDLDPMALDLPPSRFEWIFSSHLLNSVASCQAAVREMFRVAGPGGVVVASVGRSSSAATEPIATTSAPRVFSELFAEDVRSIVPDAGVLEVTATDPSTGTRDALYFCSVDEHRLARVASALASHGIAVHRHLRSPSSGAGGLASTRPKNDGASVLARLWQELHDEVQQWSSADGGATLWLRDDDVGTTSPALVSLMKLCENEAVPLALAAIPTRVDRHLIELVNASPHVQVLLHGFDHRNRSTINQASEFPVEREPNEVLRQLRTGWTTLAAAMGESAFPVFVPPWGTCSSSVRELLPRLGIVGFSGSPVGAFQGDQLWRRGRGRSDGGLVLANAHVAVNRRSADPTSPFPAARIVAFLVRLVRAIRLDAADRREPVGILTHDWGVDPEVEDFFKRLFEVTRRANAQWISARSVFSSPAGAQVVAPPLRL